MKISPAFILAPFFPLATIHAAILSRMSLDPQALTWEQLYFLLVFFFARSQETNLS